MPDIQQGQQLILAQNQHAFVQDMTKGNVQVCVGPHSMPLGQNDTPVVYDGIKNVFKRVDLSSAVQQNPLVPEGHYLVLDNPVTEADGKLRTPKGGSNATVDLQVGRKIVIPGPVTFPLWPGQSAQSIPGHHLRSNQYLVVRVYNAEEAEKNAPSYLKDNKGFTPGRSFVIKGTEVSFFIPPTGFEVLKESDGGYVREALTLERLEYAILLDEDGNKRYERGPQVVFPAATEKFVMRPDGGDDKRQARKFKAIELNDQMGLYVKVIADYEEVVEFDQNAVYEPPLYRIERSEGSNGGTSTIYRQYQTGEELFITGKDQRIYYPRPEHALVEYRDPKEKINRQRYYGITIPKGEGRYVLNKAAGDIVKITGPCIYLPDPRNEVIVRRIIDQRTVSLLYPGNAAALAFNMQLSQLAEGSTTYVADAAFLEAAADITRSMNRSTSASTSLTSNLNVSAQNTIRRSGTFTAPPTLTLDTKYDGVPTINVWTGYAVQVVNKAGQRRVVVGPATILLEYDEELAAFELSTGKPKTTDRLMHDVYLRVDHNTISDEVLVTTEDLVGVKIKLGYRVNFLRGHEDKWFAVENYVKYLCDHMRSRLKAESKKQGITAIMKDSTIFVRDTVLGLKKEGARRSYLFEENGMEVYDVEVLDVAIADGDIANRLRQAQNTAVQTAITLTADEQNLIAKRRKYEIQKELDDLEHEAALRTQDRARELDTAKSATELARQDASFLIRTKALEAEREDQEHHDAISTSELNRDKARGNYQLEVSAKETDMFKERMEALTPNVVAAVTIMSDNKMMTDLSKAIAPLAMNEQTGLGQTLERVFQGTPVASLLENIKRRGHAGVATSTVGDDD